MKTSRVSLPQGQEWLIECMQKLGYQADPRGVCFGVAHMGMQAILAEEVDIFDKRWKDIYSISPDNFLQEIESLKEKRKQQKGLAIDPLLNISPFFEGIELYHQPSKYPDLFGK